MTLNQPQTAAAPVSASQYIWGLVKSWPLVTWAVIAGLILLLLSIFNVEYDSMPFGLLVITEWLWAWMYLAPSELLFGLHGGTAMPHHQILSVLLGLPLAFVADLFLHLIRGWSGLTRES